MSHTRPSPSESATLYKVGIKKTGNDGNKWIIAENKNGVKKWKLYKKVTSKKAISKKAISKKVTSKKVTSKKAISKKKVIKKKKENPWYPQIYIFIDLKYDSNDDKQILIDYFTKFNKKYKVAWEYGKDDFSANIYKFDDKDKISEIRKFLKKNKFIKSFNIHFSYEDEDGEIQEYDI
jgi:hypothetical protein